MLAVEARAPGAAGPQGAPCVSLPADGAASGGADTVPSPDRTVVRRACPRDVPGMEALLACYIQHELVLPRTSAQLYRHIREFVVAVDRGEVVGCAGLRVYSSDLGEVTALAVSERCQGQRIGRRMVESLIEEATAFGLRRLFALTMREEFFHHLGFRTVPRSEVPEKLEADRIEGIDRSACKKAMVVLDLIADR